MIWDYRYKLMAGLMVCVLIFGAGTLMSSMLNDDDTVNKGHFPNVLQWSLPEPFDNNGRFRGMDWATVQGLEESKKERSDRRFVTYVDKNTESKNNLTVSVNPIDRFTWSATSFASNGRCYAILSQVDRNNIDFGETYMGILDPGFPCLASRATPETVRLTDEPN